MHFVMIKQHFLLKGILCNFFIDLSYRQARFVWCNAVPHTPPLCEHSAIVYNVHDPSSLAPNHFSYSHIEACSGPVQHLMRSSPDLNSNVILERIKSFRIVSIDQGRANLFNGRLICRKPQTPESRKMSL